jgi:hypothetical protein
VATGLLVVGVHTAVHARCALLGLANRAASGGRQPAADARGVAVLEKLRGNRSGRPIVVGCPGPVGLMYSVLDTGRTVMCQNVLIVGFKIVIVMA